MQREIKIEGKDPYEVFAGEPPVQRENKWQDRLAERFPDGIVQEVDFRGTKNLLAFIQSEIDRAVAEERKRLLAELIETEEWKRRGDMHPMWNKAKTNTIQELKSFDKELK